MVFVAAFCVFGLALLGMSVGVIFSDRRIQGSCGGVANMGGKHRKLACDGCPSGGKYCSDGGHHAAEEGS